MIKVREDAPDRSPESLESYERKAFEEMTDNELLEAAADALSDYVSTHWDGGGSQAPGELLTKELYVEMWKRCGRIER